MKKVYTNIRIKVDEFTVGDYEAIRHLAIKHDVPDRAGVRIDTTGLGTYISFEWTAEQPLDYKKKVQRPIPYPKDEWRIPYKK